MAVNVNPPKGPAIRVDGAGPPPCDRRRSDKASMRAVITVIILVLLAMLTIMAIRNPDDGAREYVIQAVLSLANIAIGYYMGSSKGSDDKTELLGAAMRRQGHDE